MQLRRMLGIQPGLTAIIGGGGKTTLLYALARELSQTARVIVCTTTHILPPEHLPCLTDGTETEIRRTLKKTKCVCVGTRTQEGKLTAPELAFEKLLPMADYILAEADGSKHLPLKAHAAHEPVIPPEANQTILVLGASGFGKPIAAAAHRPALYAEKLGVTPGYDCNAGACRAAHKSGRLSYAGAGQSGTDAAGAGAGAGAGGVSALPGCGRRTIKGEDDMLVLIRGAGDLASGAALRLHRANFPVVMTDLPQPTAIRRTVCFSQAIRFGKTTVEDAVGVCCKTAREVKAALSVGEIPVLPDETASCCTWLHPEVLVDGILAKRNLGTKITDAPLVIALGPGFCAGRDCHAVIETMRGHTLGRVIWDGEPIPNTNIPGLIGGFAGERVLRAPDTGIFHQLRDIGALVTVGETVGEVNGLPMSCTIAGVLRGILPDGTPVTKGMKSGDVDPRAKVENCYTVSDKASAIAGGVLEAILHKMPLTDGSLHMDMEGTL